MSSRLTRRDAIRTTAAAGLAASITGTMMQVNAETAISQSDLVPHSFLTPENNFMMSRVAIQNRFHLPARRCRMRN